MFFSSHNHSHFSNYRLLDAINRPDHLFNRAIELGLSGFAITDHESLSAHVQILQHRDKLKKEGKLPEGFTVALGNEAYLVDDLGMGIKYYHWLLIAKDKKGHEILRKLSSRAWKNSYWDRNMERVPLTKEQVEQIMTENDGKGHIIVTSACLGGELGTNALAIKAIQENGVQADPLLNNMMDKYMDEWLAIKDVDAQELINCHKQEMADYVAWNVKVFGKENFFIELAPNDKEEQRFSNRMLWNVAKAYGIKPIFATDSHYLTKEDQAIHRALLNSKDGEREVDDFYSTAYMMEYHELEKYMLLDFSKEQIQEMIDNLEYMRSNIEEYSIFHDQVIPQVGLTLPTLMHPLVDEKYVNLHILMNDKDIQSQYWARQCLNELFKREKWNEEYLSTLEKEAEVLVKVSERLGQNMAAYYNTAKRLIEIMWDKGDSLVGVSRGSAMAFVSNWLLDITQIDPIPYKVPYWRHLSAERPELPDVDIDSQGFKRDQIIEAMKEEFGYDHVLNICTYGTEGTKSAIATAARGLGISNDVALYLSGMVPNERGFDWSLKDITQGNPEKGRRAIAPFIAEISQYPGWLETAMSIEGLVTKRGSHAAGVYFFNDGYTSINAMMRTPSGLEVTQWDMNESDLLGGVKFDFLSIEGLDKIRACMDLLLEDGLMEDKGSLKATYDHYLHPENLDYSIEMWKPAWSGEVLDLFQFQTPVGGQAIQKAKPETVIQAADVNSLMRLTAFPDGEMPIDKYVRMSLNIDEWYQELEKAEVPRVDYQILEPHYLPAFGVPNSQEQLMILLMDEKVCNFSESDANMARKIIGKKQMEKIPFLKDKIFAEATCGEKTIQYIWDTAVQVQLGYSFSLPHTIAYSIIALQELNLYKRFSPIYWNTGCLIVNSGDEGSGTDYKKIAVAIGNILGHGVEIGLLDINESGYNFRPSPKTNSILYGFKAATGIGEALIPEIINNRPYTDMDDFIIKVKPNKVALLSLIKAGAFDKIEGFSRRFLLAKALRGEMGYRSKLTTANIPLLASFGLIDEEVRNEYRLYEFNRYLKAETKRKDKFIFDERAQAFYTEYGFDEMLLEYGDNGSLSLLVKTWEKLYDKAIQPMRDWLGSNKERLIGIIEDQELVAEFNKYGAGSISKWEMDSLCFYHSEHELAGLDNEHYGIARFGELNPQADIDYTFEAFGKTIPIFKQNTIAGTVIAKEKTKGSLYLLTPEGDVVTVKMNKEKFSEYDRQVSREIGNGKKEVIEKSWFARGNLLLISGYRRDDQFVPKAYKQSLKREIYLITDLLEDGKLKLKSSRG